MNLYHAENIRAWDAYTICHEPVDSIDLMERAAKACTDWLLRKYGCEQSFAIFCGPGNNGGDGLAMARQLLTAGCGISVYLFPGKTASADFQVNLRRLKEMGQELIHLDRNSALPVVPPAMVVVDALFGSGISRRLEGFAEVLVSYLNSLSVDIISIDLPSGLSVEGIAEGAVIQATYTLRFEVPAPSFFFAENDPFLGQWHVLPIGLHPGFHSTTRPDAIFADAAWMRGIRPSPRPRHAHKGHFGHAVLLAGSQGMMGAAVMAARACLHSGVGLLTVGVPESDFNLLHSRVPEAMCGGNALWRDEAWYQNKTAVGAGPGWMPDEYHGHVLQWLLTHIRAPLLLDATALTLLARNTNWLNLRPPGAITVLTPHVGEFHRLFGVCKNSLHRQQVALQAAQQHQVFILLKGAYTQLITPGGLIYYNSTGNPGMARGGSGDILTGFITGLLAQGLATPVACLLGMYLHGLAGDEAALKYTQQGMTSMDICKMLPVAWQKLWTVG